MAFHAPPPIIRAGGRFGRVRTPLDLSALLRRGVRTPLMTCEYASQNVGRCDDVVARQRAQRQGQGRAVQPSLCCYSRAEAAKGYCPP